MADEQQRPEGDETAESAEPAGEGQPASEQSEEELRAQLEDQIRNLKVEDVILQSAVSILNLAARRTAKEDERDRTGEVGIEAARARPSLCSRTRAPPGGLERVAAVREARGRGREARGWGRRNIPRRPFQRLTGAERT